jgi:hypothetical protein
MRKLTIVTGAPDAPETGRVIEVIRRSPTNDHGEALPYPQGIDTVQAFLCAWCAVLVIITLTACRCISEPDHHVSVLIRYKSVHIENDNEAGVV